MAIGSDPHVLVVAGCDSSGGAGIIRDVETVAHFGLKSCAAITAVTAQTDNKVSAVRIMDANLVAEQMSAAFADRQIGAVKIGMLATAEIVECVAAILLQHPEIPVVVDPVLFSTSGTRLLTSKGVSLLIERLLPIATLTTPNRPELAQLSGMSEIDENFEAACERLKASGARALLVKGGHSEGKDASDILIRPGIPACSFSATRSAATLRGTGCMLASGIAAGLAKGALIETAIDDAKAYVTRMFADRFQP